MKGLSVIIPGRGLVDVAQECFARVHRYAPGAEIVYVDNGSEELEQSRLRTFLQRGDMFLEFRRNEGFTAATNHGAAAALAAGASHLLLLNNDAYLGRSTVERLAGALACHPTLAAVGPLTDGPNGRHHFRHGAGRVRFQAIADDDTIEEKEEQIAALAPTNVVQPAPVLAFFCTLIPRWAWESIGPLDGRFADGLGADDDWCLRARQQQTSVGICQSAFCGHLGRSTFKALALPRDCSAAYRKLEAKHGRNQ